MKSKELFDLMSTIDEKYIEEAGEERGGGKLSEKLWFGAVAAACAVVFVGGLLAGSYLFGSASDKPNLPGSEPGHTDTENPGTDPSDTDHRPQDAETDYVVENGVLLSYTGEATELTIPEEVTEITADSFSSNANCRSISAIHLNSAVSKIDENAFSELDSLKTLTVSDENSNFNFNDGVIGAVDGSVYFGTADIWQDEESFFRKIMEMEENLEEYEEVSCISAGSVVIELCREDYEVGKVLSAFGHHYYYFTNFSVKSIQAYGHKKTFDVPEFLGEDDIRVSAYQTDGAFVFSIQKYIEDINSSFVFPDAAPVMSDTYIFTEDGIYETITSTWSESGYRDWYNTLDSDWYVDLVTVFSKREDGKLGYTRTTKPYALLNTSWENDIFKYCVSRDEYCKDVGYISFENGRLTYVPEQIYTVSDLLDLEKWYYGDDKYPGYMRIRQYELDYLRETGEYEFRVGTGEIREEDGLVFLYDFPLGLTLDEYLEYNSRRYKRAEMPQNTYDT